MFDEFLSALPRTNGRPGVGRIALLHPVGRGAMGAVYAGWHGHLDMPVAVKFLLGELGGLGDTGDDSRLAKFRREAQILALIDEPAVVRVLDFGLEADIPYLVMEWVPGKGLDAVVAEGGPFREEEVLTVLRDVGQALLALHDKNVIHRDIKPSNLLLRSSDGRIKIADLGIAKQTDRQGSTDTVSIVGTPAFMSPEQVESPRDVGPHSDLFALGVTAYYLLTGQMPFLGATAWATMKRVCEMPLPHPRDHGVEISPGAWDMIVALTQKEIGQRIARAGRLLERLPAVSVPFRPVLLDAARPGFSPFAPVGTLDRTAVSTLDTEKRVGQGGGTMTFVPRRETAIRSLMLCQCLQNDFIAPYDALQARAQAEGHTGGYGTLSPPNRLHVGWNESARIVGMEPADGPMVRAVASCAESDHVGMVYVRDWHDKNDPKQKAELDFFGPHCLMGTWGARLIDVLEAYSRDRRRSAVVDATGINDCSDTPLLKVLDHWIDADERATVPVGVIGVWTNVKVHYLLYDLKTRGGFHNLATCSALVASPDAAAHESTLRHLAMVLNVKVFERIDEFLDFLGVERGALARKEPVVGTVAF